MRAMSGFQGAIGANPHLPGDFATQVPTRRGYDHRRQHPHKHKGHDLFRVRDLSARSSQNCSVWAKGDLNPHVPKDTGT